MQLYYINPQTHAHIYNTTFPFWRLLEVWEKSFGDCSVKNTHLCVLLCLFSTRRSFAAQHIHSHRNEHESIENTQFHRWAGGRAFRWLGMRVQNMSTNEHDTTSSTTVPAWASCNRRRRPKRNNYVRPNRMCANGLCSLTCLMKTLSPSPVCVCVCVCDGKGWSHSLSGPMRVAQK